jgi:hypothetical protein
MRRAVHFFHQLIHSYSNRERAHSIVLKVSIHAAL